MGLIQGIGLAKSAYNALKGKNRLPPEPPKPPEREGGASGAGWTHPQFSEEDEQLIAEFRSSPIKTPAHVDGFFDEYQETVDGFCNTHAPQDWERLTRFFLKHSSHAKELNEAGIKEVSHRLAEHVREYGKRSLLPSVISSSYRSVSNYLQSSPIRPGEPEYNAMESVMRQAPSVSDTFFGVVKDTMLAEVKRDPRFRRK